MELEPRSNPPGTASDGSARPGRTRAVVLAVGLACAGAELVLRRAEPETDVRLPRVLQARAAVRDERLLYRLIPNLETQDADGVVYRTNAQGYRDRDWPAPVAAEKDELRVAVLGDSVPYGSGVAVEDAFPRALERTLRERLTPRARAASAPRDEVLVQSFAVPAYKLDQMLLVLEEEALAYDPAVVVLFLGPNSVRETPFDANAFRGVLTEESAGPLDELFERSLLFRRSSELLERASRRGREWIGLGTTVPPPSVREVRASALAGLDEARADLKRAGRHLVVVTNPWYGDVVEIPDASSPWSEASTSLREWAEHAPDVVFVPSAPLLRAAMPRLLAALEQGVLERDDVWPSDGEPLFPFEHEDELLFLRHDRLHLSPLGHRVLAEGVFERMDGLGVFERESGDALDAAAGVRTNTGERR